MTEPMRAWAIYHDNFEVLAIYAAATRGKAIAAAYNQARDVGYNVKWTDFRCRRAPQFDKLASGANCRPYPLGYHSRAYDMDGTVSGYDQFGCLDGLRRHPRKAYEQIKAVAL